MKIGYVRGRKLNQQMDRLEAVSVEELFSDGGREYDILTEEASEYQELWNFIEPDDELVLTSLEVISRDYEELLSFVQQVKESKVQLTVLDMPKCTIEEWVQLVTWIQKNNRLIYPRAYRLGKEKKRNRTSYSIFSREYEAKRLYREILWQLLRKKTYKTIAKHQGVPVETVHRIKKELDRAKLAISLVLCFFLAIFSIKLAESYFDELWIQIAACIVTTMVILYNVLADSQSEGER